MLFGSVAARAQAPADSLFVVPMADGWMLMAEVQPGESIPVLARRYFVPPAILASANAKEISELLRTGSTLFIPLAAYNLTHRLPAAGQVDLRPLYYRVENGEERLPKIARGGGITQSDLRNWNRLETAELHKGQTLIVGGLRYDATGTFGKGNNVLPATGTTGVPAQKQPDTAAGAPTMDAAGATGLPVYDSMAVTDSVPAVKVLPKRSAEALAFEELEAAGVGFVSEKGTAVFFPSRSKTTLYAFHNLAGKGSVIKITNPLNGRAVYAKVLGPLPPTAQYARATVGLSSGAQALLGSKGDARMWCEVAYVGY